MSDVYCKYISYHYKSDDLLKFTLARQDVAQLHFEDVEVEVEGTQHVVVSRLTMVCYVLKGYVSVL